MGRSQTDAVSAYSYAVTEFERPSFLLAGFAAVAPHPEVPELVHVGEQWAPATHEIGPHVHGVWELYSQVEGQTTWRDGRG